MEDQPLELVGPLAEDFLVVMQICADEVLLGGQVGYIFDRYAESPDGDNDDENGGEGEDGLAGDGVWEVGILAARADGDEQADPTG